MSRIKAQQEETVATERFEVHPMEGNVIALHLLPRGVSGFPGTPVAKLDFAEADLLSRKLMLAAAAVRKHAREGSPAEFARTLSINDHIGLITEELAWWQQRKEKAFSNAGHGSHARITEDTEQMIPRIMDSLARMSRILLAQPESSGIHRAIEQAPRDPEAELARRVMAGAQVTTGVVHAPLSPAAERMMRKPTPKPDTELTPPIL